MIGKASTLILVMLYVFMIGLLAGVYIELG